ncbi:MAG: GMC family oxidoreductase [Hyphomicrobiales bacterium]|nr:GMC family oxidoreductase [Hyphomicrobiales bacterium]
MSAGFPSTGLTCLERAVADSTRPEHADVLVIGSGAGGALASLVLGQAGLKVVCLEQGGWTAPDDHPHFAADWEWQRQIAWNPNNNYRTASADFPVESATSNILMWNAVGGSTNIYTALWPRYRPSDFRKGAEHGLAPDWPIAYEDLAPFYDAIDRIVGTSGLAGDLASPSRPDYPTPPLPLRPVGRRLAQGFDRLGWHWWPMPAGVVSEDYDGRPACTGCAGCVSGCPIGAMSKFSLSVWPKALRAGVELRTQARVERIERDKSGRATGAVYRDRSTGAERRQTADVVIVACNGVGTPRLLLLSDNLANGSDQVGRNLMHHTLVACEMWVEENLESHMGFVGALISAEFAETDVSRGFVNGFNFNCTAGAHAGTHALGPLSGVRAPWGREHHAWFRRHFGHGFGAFAIGDDLPQPTNRVTLSAHLTDADGLAAPHIEYQPHENDRRMMRFALDRLKDLAIAVDAFDYRLHDYVSPEGIYQTPAWHLLGTCRMGARPEDSVINRWHQSWDVPNLYIIDGSALATGGVVNPTATICALALRASEHLRDNFRELRGATKSDPGS